MEQQLVFQTDMMLNPTVNQIALFFFIVNFQMYEMFTLKFGHDDHWIEFIFYSPKGYGGGGYTAPGHGNGYGNIYS